MKKFMTIQELFDFLSDQIEIEITELTEYMENENIQPKTKMSNIQRYEQEDCQKIYDYFVANKPKKSSKKKAAGEREKEIRSTRNNTRKSRVYDS